MNKTFKALSVAFLSGLAIDMPESKATGLLTQEALAEGDAPEERLVVAPPTGDYANWSRLPDDLMCEVMMHLNLEDHDSLASISPEGARLARDEAFRERWRYCHLHEYLPELFGKEIAEKMLEEYRRALKEHRRALDEGKESTFVYKGYAEKILSGKSIKCLRSIRGRRIIRRMMRLKDNPPMLLTLANLLAEDFEYHAGLPDLMEALGLERFNALLKRLEQPDIHILCRRHVDCFVYPPDNSQEENLQVFLTACRIISAQLPDKYLNDGVVGYFTELSTREDVEKRLRIACQSFEELLSGELSEVNIEKKSELIMQLSLFPNLDEIERAAELAHNFLLPLPKRNCDVGLVLSAFIEKKSLQKMKYILNSLREPKDFDKFYSQSYLFGYVDSCNCTGRLVSFLKFS